jgi:hypothetical protein
MGQVGDYLPHMLREALPVGNATSVRLASGQRDLFKSQPLATVIVVVVAVAPMNVAMPVAIDPVAVFISIAIMIAIGARTWRNNTTR